MDQVKVSTDTTDENGDPVTEAHRSIVAVGDGEGSIVSTVDEGGATKLHVRDSTAGATLASVLAELTAILSTQTDVKRGVSDAENRLDYDVRTDKNPVYVGTAPNGTATSAAAWSILKLSYDASARLTRKQVLLDQVWDDRASLSW